MTIEEQLAKAERERDEARLKLAGTPAWQRACEQSRRDLAHAEAEVDRLRKDIEELEGRTTYAVGETEWAHRIANAEQRALTAEAECIALRRELARLMDDH
jgi:chromosome segregation ATPase